MPAIRLHVQKESRRDALVRRLGKEHEVLLGGSAADQDRQEDLLILDHTTLQQSGAGALSRYKGNDPRPESPILLLVPSARKPDLTAPVWKQIDDVVEMPVRWPEMKSRIQVLIRTQKIAREEESVRQMAAKYKLMLEEQQRRLTGYKALFKKCACETLVVQDGEVVEATSQAEQLFGTDDLVGRSFGSLSPPQQPGGQNSKLKAEDLFEVAEEETKRTEWEFKRPGGQTFLSPIVLTSVQFKGEECVQVLFPEGATDNTAVFS